MPFVVEDKGLVFSNERASPMFTGPEVPSGSYSFQTEFKPAYQLKSIGDYLRFGPAADRGMRVSNHIRAKLGVADFIPIDYQLNFQALNQAKSKEFAIKYKFIEAIEEYQNICKNYDLPNEFAGVRLWMTDHTAVTESFNHDYDDNVIQLGLNQLTGYGQTLRSFMKATGTTLERKTEEITETAIQDMQSRMKGQMPLPAGADVMLGKIVEFLSGAGQLSKNLILHGKAVSLPKIWRHSSYSPAIAFNIRLVSPYGHPESIENFILEPLLYLLLLSAARSNDGLSYGLPPILHIKSYGLTNIKLGAITSITISKGGDGTAFNIYKQPLSVDISISVTPLTDGFAAISEEKKDYVRFKKQASYEDQVSMDKEASSSFPAITTVGDVIQSLRPAPDGIVKKYGDFSGIKTPSMMGGGLTSIIPNPFKAVTKIASNLSTNKEAVNNLGD